MMFVKLFLLTFATIVAISAKRALDKGSKKHKNRNNMEVPNVQKKSLKSSKVNNKNNVNKSLEDNNEIILEKKSEHVRELGNIPGRLALNLSYQSSIQTKEETN